jgi:hypothetical protein
MLCLSTIGARLSIAGHWWPQWHTWQVVTAAVHRMPTTCIVPHVPRPHSSAQCPIPPTAVRSESFLNDDQSHACPARPLASYRYKLKKKSIDGSEGGAGPDDGSVLLNTSSVESDDESDREVTPEELAAEEAETARKASEQAGAAGGRDASTPVGSGNHWDSIVLQRLGKEWGVSACYMRSHTHTHTHTHTHNTQHTRTHTHTHARAHTHTQTHTQCRTLTHLHTCSHILHTAPFSLPRCAGLRAPHTQQRTCTSRCRWSRAASCGRCGCQSTRPSSTSPAILKLSPTLSFASHARGSEA